MLGLKSPALARGQTYFLSWLGRSLVSSAFVFVFLGRGVSIKRTLLGVVCLVGLVAAHSIPYIKVMVN